MDGKRGRQSLVNTVKIGSEKLASHKERFLRLDDSVDRILVDRRPAKGLCKTGWDEDRRRIMTWVSGLPIVATNRFLERRELV